VLQAGISFNKITTHSLHICFGGMVFLYYRHVMYLPYRQIKLANHAVSLVGDGFAKTSVISFLYNSSLYGAPGKALKLTPKNALLWQLWAVLI